MNEHLINKINGVDIFTVERDGEIFVPIKPICQAIGIKDASQRVKIQNDDFLSSVGSIIESTGSDGKSYEMFCLPLKYVYGWLATINPGKVAPEAREAVINYRRECYDVLYEHFTGSARRAAEQAREEARLLRQRADFEATARDCRQEIKRIDEKLDRLSKERTDPQPVLF